MGANDNLMNTAIKNVVCLFNARTHRPVTWAETTKMQREGIIVFTDEKIAEAWRDEMKASVRKYLGKRMRQHFVARRIPSENLIKLSEMFHWKFFWRTIAPGCYVSGPLPVQ